MKFGHLCEAGIYCGMAVAGRFICEVAGIDYTGGFNASLDAIIAGLGYASPPIMALLFILDVSFTRKESLSLMLMMMMMKLFWCFYGKRF